MDSANRRSQGSGRRNAAIKLSGSTAIGKFEADSAKALKLSANG